MRRQSSKPCIKVLKNIDDSEMTSYLYSEEFNALITGHENGEVKLGCLDTGNIAMVFTHEDDWLHENTVSAVCVLPSPD